MTTSILKKNAKPTRAMYIRIFVNNNKDFKGMDVAITNNRYKNFDDFLRDVEYRLKSKVYLPTGIRRIYNRYGKIIKSLRDLSDSDYYFVSGLEPFKMPHVEDQNNLPNIYSTNIALGKTAKDFLHSKVPRVQTQTFKENQLIKVYHLDTGTSIHLRVIINKNSLHSLSQVFHYLTKGFREKFPVEPIEKLYSISGQCIQSIEDLWSPVNVFIAVSDIHLQWKDLQNLIHRISKEGKENQLKSDKLTESLKDHLEAKEKSLKSIMKNKNADLSTFSYINECNPNNFQDNDDKTNSRNHVEFSNYLERPDKEEKYNYEYLKNQNYEAKNVIQRNSAESKLPPPQNSIWNIPPYINSMNPFVDIQRFNPNMWQPHLYYSMQPVYNVYRDVNPNFPQPQNQELVQSNEFPKQVPYKEKYPEIDERYQIIKVIGYGKYSKIYRCRDKRGNCEFVAIKVIYRDSLPEKCESPYEELSILESIDHENIVTLIDYIDSNHRLSLIFELAEKGDLFQLLNERGPLSETHAASVINDIGSALFYLHNENIIHRNIRLENLLVFRVTHWHVYTKLGDFSLAIRISEPITTVCGSVNYISPEMADRKEYSYPVDIWALGVVSYILLSAVPPFYSIEGNKNEMLDRIRNCDYAFPLKLWGNISNDCKELIDSLLHHDPYKRLSAIDLLCNKWVVSNGNMKETNDTRVTNSISRRKELNKKLGRDNEEKGKEEVKQKDRDVCGAIKSFFDKPKQKEPVNPILEPGYLTIHNRLIKLPSTKSDPKALFDDY